MTESAIGEDEVTFMIQIVSGAILQQPTAVEYDSYAAQTDMRKRCSDTAYLLRMRLKGDEAIDKLLMALNDHATECDHYGYGLPVDDSGINNLRTIVRQWLQDGVGSV